MKKLISLLIGIIAIYMVTTPTDLGAQALRVLLPVQGGTGISTSSPLDIGKCIKVLSDSPFKYELASCGGLGSDPTIVQVDGTPQSVGTPTLNFTGNSFSLTESPADTFSIRVSTSTLGLLASSISDFVATVRSSITESVTGLTFTTGNLTLDSGYTIPTTTRAVNWDTAFGWGNHASQGYRTTENWLYNGSRLSPSTTVGIGVFASSTIGNGTGAGGLTVSGGATTTGNAYFGGNVGIGINSGNYILETNDNPYFNGVGLYTTQKKESANQKETIITTFQSGHGYTNSGGNGTLSDDTSVYAFGAQSIKMINDAIGSTMIVQKTSISPTIDVSNKIIKITAQVDSTANISNSYPSRFWLAISSDNFNNYKYCEFAYNIKQLGPGGTWLDLTCSLGDLKRSDTVDLTKINAIRIYSRSTNVTQATWWLNKISLVEVAKKPIISIVFDDGNSTDYTEAMKVMSQYGFPGTSYIIPSGIGTAGYMTLNQLNILKDNQGWQIAIHDVTDFTTLTSAQLESRFIYLKNWMTKNGFSAGADDMAYPNGNTNTDVVIPLVKKYFRSARLNGTAGIGFTETSPYGNANALNSYAVRAGDATSTVYAQIDTVVNNGGHLILVFHKLSASPSSPEYSINGFSDIMGYINTYASVGKVKVKTISDALNNEYQDNFTNIFQLPNRYIGIGTTTPSRLLTVQGGDAWIGGNLTATGTITASGGTSSDWNTAFGWGNHAGLYDPLGQSTSTLNSHLTAYNHATFITDGNTNWDNSYGFVTQGQTVGTSTAGVAGQLPYWTGIRTLGTVATTSLTASGALSLSQPVSVIGSSASALTCLTASGSQAGCLSTTDWSAFNGKVSSTSIDTLAELETLMSSINILASTELDTSLELATILGDETGSAGGGFAVFSNAPTFTGTTAFNSITVSGTSTLGNATSTTLGSTGGINLFGGGLKTTANALCIQLTGSAALCDGTDATGGASVRTYSFIVDADGAGDYTTIQGALDACGTSGGGSIYLSDPYYYIGGTGLVFKSNDCQVYGIYASTTIEIAGAVTAFKTNSAAGLYENVGIHNVVIVGDGTANSVGIDMSDMVRARYTGIIMDNIDIGFKLNDTQNITFYNTVRDFAITTIGTYGIYASSTNPANNNKFSDGFIGCTATCTGIHLNNAQANSFTNVSIEPASTVGTVGVRIDVSNSATNNGTFANKFTNAYVEANGVGIKASSTIGTKPVLANTFDGGQIVANTVNVQDSSNGTGAVQFNGSIVDYAISNAFATTTITNLIVPTSLNLFGGGAKTTANALCIQLTGSSDLCDGVDGGGAGGGGVSNWQMIGLNGIRPTTTVGIVVSASSSIDALSVRIGTTTNATSSTLFSTLATFTNLVVNTLSTFLNMVVTGLLDVGGGVLEIPNGTAPVIDSIGEMGLDSTDDQLIMADGGGTARVFGTDEFRVVSLTMASSSLQFDSGDLLAVLGFKDGLEITQFRCYVVGGTSKIVNITDGTNDTETITCGTTITSDTDVATNDTFTADELGYLEMGATSGTVDYIHFEAWARITRE